MKEATRIQIENMKTRHSELRLRATTLPARRQPRKPLPTSEPAGANTLRTGTDT